MVKALRISFSLRITYKVNAVIYFLRQILLIGKYLPEDLYSHLWIKILATVAAFGWELTTAMLGKLVYFFLMIFLAGQLYEMESTGALFGHLVLFLTAVGMHLNTYLICCDEPDYYAVLLMGMDARQYSLVNFGYALLKIMVGFLLFGLIFGLLMGAPVWLCLLVPVFVVCAKCLACGLRLRRFERTGTFTEDKLLDRLGGVFIVSMSAAAYILPMFGIVLPVWVTGSVMGLVILSGILSVRKLVHFEDYRIMYHQMRQQNLAAVAQAAASTVDQSRKQIVTDENISSKYRGFAYFNDLFFKRHRKLFRRDTLRIALAAAAILAMAAALVCYAPEIGAEINPNIMSLLPASAFVMYAINRGTHFTQALFMNCDHSLLTYSFFKRRDFVLKLFWLRLGQIIKVNLLPAAVIAAGLPLILYLSGGTPNPVDYLVLSGTVLALSVFFSVHYLTMYYLLQPYTVGTELKGGAYKFVSALTYVVCYLLLDAELPAMAFGLLAIVFCVIYCGLACVLVYHLAPRTFRLRI